MRRSNVVRQRYFGSVPEMRLSNVVRQRYFGSVPEMRRSNVVRQRYSALCRKYVAVTLYGNAIRLCAGNTWQ